MSNKNRSLNGIGLFFIATFLLSSCAIVIALIKIQAVDGKEWRRKAKEHEEQIQISEARRGSIFSSDGKTLVTTTSVCDLYFDFMWEHIKSEQGNIQLDSAGRIMKQRLIIDSLYYKYIDQVCELIHQGAPQKTPEQYKEIFTAERDREHPNRCYRMAQGIPYSVWSKIVSMPGWRRFVVQHVGNNSVIRKVRFKTYSNMAANVIGFYNGDDNKTYTGLEGYYDSTLRGTDGRFLQRRLSRNNWVNVNNSSSRYDDYSDLDSTVVDSIEFAPTIDGLDIVSTIDSRYQDIAESSLRRALIKHNAYAGCAVLMEIQTGYVLACSNLTLDTHSNAYLELPNSNIACSDLYEPGSTFKIAILTAMYNDPTMHLDTTMKLKVNFKNYAVVDGNIQDDHMSVTDSLSLADVIAQSSNVGMCELGWGYYRNRRDTLRNLVDRIVPFKHLNLDLRTSEYDGRINQLNNSARDFLNFCYGYSNHLSAMQLLTFYNAIGNNGKMVKPLFCRAIIDNGKQRVIEPVVMNESICSPATAAMIRELMKGVVDHGTGKSISNNAYGIAGKTGTSRYRYGASLTVTNRYNASFAGVFPADNPKYSCIVVLKDVRNVFGRQAAPVFKDIADCVMATDHNMQSMPLGNGLQVMHNGRWEKDETITLTPPYSTGARQADLMKIYAAMGLTYLSNDSSALWCNVANSSDEQLRYQSKNIVEGCVPDCKGMTIRDAFTLLTSLGFDVKFEGCGKVVYQSPEAGLFVRSGRTVTLKLGN